MGRGGAHVRLLVVPCVQCARRWVLPKGQGRAGLGPPWRPAGGHTRVDKNVSWPTHVLPVYVGSHALA